MKNKKPDPLYTEVVEAMERARMESETVKATNALLLADLEKADKEATKLENDYRRERDKNMRLHTLIDQLQRLIAVRTSALCALIELPDPKWVPKKEDMEP